MVNHKPNTTWAALPLGKYPQSYIRTVDKKYIRIEFCHEKAMSSDVVKITRHHARMLARRILQCLGETKKTGR